MRSEAVQFDQARSEAQFDQACSAAPCSCVAVGHGKVQQAHDTESADQ